MADERYYDEWATFYDAEHGAMTDDITFYVDRARDADGPVLEVGCGTGRVYLELLRAGVDADGIDLSTGMLSVLREKARADGLEPSVRQADVTDFDPDREYALVIIPFRAFLHLTDFADQLAALETIRDALASGGQLAMNIFAPDFDIICERYGTPQESTIERDGDEYTLVSTTEFVDEVDCIVRDRRKLYDADGEQVFAQEFRIKLLFKRELELLFSLAGFSDWSVAGGFDGDELTSPTQEMVWVADK
ncbi:class I SAM-dependent methyltransferase [Haladaptatus sp. DJG-WS-42]|uniref:class I SAM-dependent methyltransferase n=1 Tax=Haladaptatus sp. DJG-WS-42 TaxID=3120516 RepID=UPI0030D25547